MKSELEEFDIHRTYGRKEGNSKQRVFLRRCQDRGINNGINETSHNYKVY